MFYSIKLENLMRHQKNTKSRKNIKYLALDTVNKRQIYMRDKRHEKTRNGSTL